MSTHASHIHSIKRELDKLRGLASRERRGALHLMDEPRFREQLAQVEMDLRALEWSVLRLAEEQTPYNALAVRSALKLRAARRFISVFCNCRSTHSDVVVAKAGRFVAAQGVQLHGGYGVSDVYEVGHYFKKLTVFEKLLGDIDYHTERFIAAGDRTSDEVT